VERPLRPEERLTVERWSGRPPADDLTVVLVD
jgi:hypothetical protein